MRTLKAGLLEFCRLMIPMVALLGLSATYPTGVSAAEKNDVNVAKAMEDLNALKAALVKFKADTGVWPNRIDGSNPATATAEVLYSEGNIIASPGNWPLDNSLIYKQIRGYFVDDDRNYAKWKGPYIARDSADPWGNTYLIGVKNLDKGNLPVWIISAGPDGVLQTPIDSPVCMDGKSIDSATGLVAVGDDICLKFI